MSIPRTWVLVAGALTCLIAGAVPATAQRISAELEASQLSVVNGVAEATFKIVVTNDEAGAITGAYLVFDDGFEVSVGDVAGESTGASESTTRAIDLSDHGETRNVSLPATLKYAVNGEPVEQAVHIVLRLPEQ